MIWNIKTRIITYLRTKLPFFDWIYGLNLFTVSICYNWICTILFLWSFISFKNFIFSCRKENIFGRQVCTPFFFFCKEKIDSKTVKQNNCVEFSFTYFMLCKLFHPYLISCDIKFWSFLCPRKSSIRVILMYFCSIYGDIGDYQPNFGAKSKKDKKPAKTSQYFHKSSIDVSSNIFIYI